MITIRVGDLRVVFGGTEIAGKFDAVVVLLFSSEGFVLVKNEERAWEFPGGHRKYEESWVETAVREVYEETGVRISDIEYLGYYSTSKEHVTVIACTEVRTNEWMCKDSVSSRVEIFNRLPVDLSFGDGREQLFLDYASAFRSNSMEESM